MNDPLTFDVTRKINTRLLLIWLSFVGLHVSLLLFALLTYSKVEEVTTSNLEASTSYKIRLCLQAGRVTLAPCKCSAKGNSPTLVNSILAPKSKIWSQYRQNQRITTKKTSIYFTICHISALEINYFPVLLSVCVLLARLPKRNKR